MSLNSYLYFTCPPPFTTCNERDQFKETKGESSWSLTQTRKPSTHVWLVFLFKTTKYAAASNVLSLSSHECCFSVMHSYLVRDSQLTAEVVQVNRIVFSTVSLCHCHVMSEWPTRAWCIQALPLQNIPPLQFVLFLSEMFFSPFIPSAGHPIKNNESSFSCLCPWPQRS